MILPALPSSSASVRAICRLPTMLRLRISRRRWGVREFVCGGVGELMGLQVGAMVSFHLINNDLLPEPTHQVAWSMSLILGSLLGGTMGWWLARVSREEPQRVRIK